MLKPSMRTKDQAWVDEYIRERYTYGGPTNRSSAQNDPAFQSFVKKVQEAGGADQTTSHPNGKTSRRIFGGARAYSKWSRNLGLRRVLR